MVFSALVDADFLDTEAYYASVSNDERSAKSYGYWRPTGSASSDKRGVIGASKAPCMDGRTVSP